MSESIALQKKRKGGAGGGEGIRPAKNTASKALNALDTAGTWK